MNTFDLKDFQSWFWWNILELRIFQSQFWFCVYYTIYIHNKLSFCFVEHEKCYVCLFVHLHVCLIAWEHVYSYYVSVVKIVNMTLVCNEISLSHTFILYLNLIANISFLGTIKLEQESQLFIGVKYFDKISQTQKTKLMIGDYFTEKSNY